MLSCATFLFMLVAIELNKKLNFLLAKECNIFFLLLQATKICLCKLTFTNPQFVLKDQLCVKLSCSPSLFFVALPLHFEIEHNLCGLCVISWVMHLTTERYILIVSKHVSK